MEYIVRRDKTTANVVPTNKKMYKFDIMLD